MPYNGYDHWFVPYKMTECPKSSKIPEKLAFLEFNPHMVEIIFSIFIYFLLWGGGGGGGKGGEGGGGEGGGARLYCTWT